MSKIILSLLLFISLSFLPFPAKLTYGAVGGSAGRGIEIPTTTGLPNGTIVGTLNRILNWLLMIFVIIAVIGFVITGLQFIFSFGGASGSQEQAKKNLAYTIIAIFIVGGGLIILKTILFLLGGQNAGGGGGSGSFGGGGGDSTNYGTIDDNYMYMGDIWGSDNSNNTPYVITTDATATGGGVYVPEGVYNNSPSSGNITSNP